MVEVNPVPLRRAPVRVDEYRCLRVRHYLAGCAECREACSRAAISLEPGPSVNPTTCDGCGACVAACPTEGLEARGLRIETVVQGVQGDEAEFACVHLRSSGRNAVQLPCLAFLDAGALLALAAPNRRVVLETGPCATCPDAVVRGRLIAGAVAVANTILAERGAGGAVVCKQTGVYVAQASVSRRELFGFLRRKARERLEADPEAPSTPVAKGKASRGALRPERRGLLLEGLARLGAPAESSPAAAQVPLPFFALSLDEACDDCGMCLTFCPTATLRGERADGVHALVFSADYCLGCGLCETVCPKGALRVERLGVSPPVGVSRALSRRALRHCARCGQPFAAVGEERHCRECVKRETLRGAIRRSLFGG